MQICSLLQECCNTPSPITIPQCAWKDSSPCKICCPQIFFPKIRILWNYIFPSKIPQMLCTSLHLVSCILYFFKIHWRFLYIVCVIIACYFVLNIIQNGENVDAFFYRILFIVRICQEAFKYVWIQDVTMSHAMSIVRQWSNLLMDIFMRIESEEGYTLHTHTNRANNSNTYAFDYEECE